jgi:folate-binding protein YgfZ
MGSELDERTIAAEAHLVERTVSFTKGCYTGQELVARLDARGSRVARRLCGLVPVAGAGGAAMPTGGADPGALVGASLLGPDGVKQVGRITSAAWCPGLGGPAALGYVHRSVEIGESVTLETDGGPDGSTRALEVRALPMI